MDKPIYKFILEEETKWKVDRVPITASKDWNMHEHIERCTNVSNAWYHKGKNDGMRPYDDIVTPIMNVAFRSQGFDVKDIVPYIQDVTQSYKSFMVKTYHPQWARKNKIDTFIDDVVESSVIYDLVIVKNVNGITPVIVNLQEIAFCDQTDALAGPLGLRHQYSIAELLEFKGKWESDKIDEAIIMSQAEKTVSLAFDQKIATPGKYIEVYEVHGMFPESWYMENGDPEKYVPQLHIVTYYRSENGKRNGITLFKGLEKGLPKGEIFKQLKLDRKLFGRACGRSLIETLFEPQVWNNYSAIRIKDLLDGAALNLFQSASDELANQKLKGLKTNTILKHEPGHPITKVDTTQPNMTPFTNNQIKQENSARVIGSASDTELGRNPVSGTPFALQNLVVQQGQGFHEYRQGKIATFFADQLYPDWILPALVKEMNSGKSFSEELSLDELQQVAEQITVNMVDKKIKDQILKGGKVPTEGERISLRQIFKDEFIAKGNRKFFEVIKGELSNIPVDVFINIKGKQRYMAQNADKITNIIREVIRNPQAFTQIPGIGKAFNELIEESGFSPIDFSAMIKDTGDLQPQTQELQDVVPEAEDNKK